MISSTSISRGVMLMAVLVALAAHDATASGPARSTSQDPGQTPTAPPLPGGRSCGRMSTSFGAIYASRVSVRRISCRAAKRALQRTRVGQDRPPGWRCRTVGEVYEGYTQRCTRGRRAMQFDAGV